MSQKKHSAEWIIARVEEYIDGKGSYSEISRSNGRVNTAIRQRKAESAVPVLNIGAALSDISQEQGSTFIPILFFASAGTKQGTAPADHAAGFKKR